MVWINVVNDTGRLSKMFDKLTDTLWFLPDCDEILITRLLESWVNWGLEIFIELMLEPSGYLLSDDLLAHKWVRERGDWRKVSQAWVGKVSIWGDKYGSWAGRPQRAWWPAATASTASQELPLPSTFPLPSSFPPSSPPQTPPSQCSFSLPSPPHIIVTSLPPSSHY